MHRWVGCHWGAAVLLAAACAHADGMDTARALVEAERWKEAAAALRARTAEAPEDAEAWALLVMALAQTNDPEGALEALGRAVEGGYPVGTERYRPALDGVIQEIVTVRDPARRATLCETALSVPALAYAQAGITAHLAGAYGAQGDAARAEALEPQILAEGAPSRWAISLARGYAMGPGEFTSRAVTILERVLGAEEARIAAAAGRASPDALRTARAELQTTWGSLSLAYSKAGVRDPARNRIAAAEAEPGARFAEVTQETGLAGRIEKRIAAGDFDGDGFDDLLLDGCVLLRNEGGTRFSDVTARAGLVSVGSRGGIWADLDNDGRMDIIQAAAPSLRIYRNAGDGTFEDATVRMGADAPLPAPPEGLGAADYDRDGWVDLYVACYETRIGEGAPHVLLRNDGGTRLVDVSEAAGIRSVPPRAGRGVAWADFDDDGDPDCFVSNYRLHPNFLWRNRGDGTFEEAAPALEVQGIGVPQPMYGHTIGSAWGDADGDGDLDLLCANLAHPRYLGFSDPTALFLQETGADGRRRFRDVQPGAGIAFEETHSDPSFVDYDNDGDMDVFLTSTYEACPTFLYQNEGAGEDGVPRFRPATWRAGVVTYDGWGHAWFDMDADGDMDLAVASRSDGVRLFRNGGTPGRRSVTVRLEGDGRRSNRAGIGARVTVRCGERSWIREVASGRGTTSGDSLAVHVGLGDVQGPVQVAIRWPDGTTSTHEAPADGRMSVRQPGE